jgi:hypothetical protein
MKKHIRIITFSIAIAALVAIIGVATNQFNFPIEIAKFVPMYGGQHSDSRTLTVTEQTLSGDDILFVHHNNADNSLRLDFVGGESEVVHLDPNSLAIETFEFQRMGKPVYLRFFSPAFYESYGQTSQGVVILTGMNPADIRGDPYNKVATDFPVVEQSTTADLSFALIHYYLENHNKVDTERPVCNADNANGLLSGVASSSCYIVCQGKSEVMAHFLAASTRIVPMWSRRENLDGGYIFLSSELHTTLEIFDNAKWYVADPTYGFAYVKDTTGMRLDTKDLIAALAQEKGSELIFGLVHNGAIYEVPSELVIKENPTMPSIYYTPDKRLEYRKIRDEPEFHD